MDKEKNKAFESYYAAASGDPMAMLEEAGKEMEFFNKALDGDTSDSEDALSYCEQLLDELGRIETSLLPPSVRSSADQALKTLAVAKAITKQASAVIAEAEKVGQQAVSNQDTKDTSEQEDASVENDTDEQAEPEVVSETTEA